ncbi:MAG: hypothetical protein DME25_06775 [Verrucomicrobia bacterium]|nr:MAG: hypothetical protein DME25_06775 [Verrucomicrobiota bacterium]
MANKVFDWLMPRLAGHLLFLPTLLAAGVLLLCKGGRRGRVFVLCLALAIGVADGVVTNTIKKLVARPRPCIALADARVLIGCSDSGSMPSAHAANWFAATMVGFVFYRRSWRGMLPAAATIAFSRVYNGVHYPSDVVAGAMVGAGSAVAVVWWANALWGLIGRKWFPLWWQRLPSLVEGRETRKPTPDTSATGQATLDAHWLRLGYVLIVALLLFRLGYLASGAIQLSKDEAYQWLWSKHLALSYYSKPPGIALIQFGGTSLWGDTQFGVRFFSPVFAALLSFVLLRFLARETGARLGFLVLLIVNCVPLLGVGAILMTIDPPLVLCWTLAMIAGWRAVQPAGTTKHWLLAGVATGLGFLSKYSALYLLVCWALFFVLWPPARVQLKRPGPYLALLIVALSTLPVILWNSQHGWITVQHVSENAALGGTWRPTLRYVWEFLGAEAGLLNPVFFAGALWAMAAFWPRRQQNPLWLYLFCLGAPVFLGHLAWSFHSRIQPNWIAPAVLPMFCLMALYWETRWREGVRAVKGWLAAGVVLGLVALVVMHESNLIGKLAGRPLPAGVDPLRRVRAWKQTSAVVAQARQKLLQEGKPTFIIADHYGMSGEFSFYLPEAKASLGTGEPLVCCQTTLEPENQLYFWPEYQYRGRRRGQNAIYVTESEPDQPVKGWVWNWLMGREIGYAEVPPPTPPPVLIRQEFESVTDLGVHEVKLGDRVFRRVQLFACRNLR